MIGSQEWALVFCDLLALGELVGQESCRFCWCPAVKSRKHIGQIRLPPVDCHNSASYRDFQNLRQILHEKLTVSIILLSERLKVP